MSSGGAGVTDGGNVGFGVGAAEGWFGVAPVEGVSFARLLLSFAFVFELSIGVGDEAGLALAFALFATPVGIPASICPVGGADG